MFLCKVLKQCEDLSDNARATTTLVSATSIYHHNHFYLQNWYCDAKHGKVHETCPNSQSLITFLPTHMQICLLFWGYRVEWTVFFRVTVSFSSMPIVVKWWRDKIPLHKKSFLGSVPLLEPSLKAVTQGMESLALQLGDVSNSMCINAQSCLQLCADAFQGIYITDSVSQIAAHHRVWGDIVAINQSISTVSIFIYWLHCGRFS